MTSPRGPREQAVLVAAIERSGGVPAPGDPMLGAETPESGPMTVAGDTARRLPRTVHRRFTIREPRHRPAARSGRRRVLAAAAARQGRYGSETDGQSPVLSGLCAVLLTETTTLDWLGRRLTCLGRGRPGQCQPVVEPVQGTEAQGGERR